LREMQAFHAIRQESLSLLFRNTSGHVLRGKKVCSSSFKLLLSSKKYIPF